MENMVTPMLLSKMLGVGRPKVMEWINSGEIKAVNVATTTATRPQYRILSDEVQRFMAARTTDVEQPTSEG